MKSPFPGMDPYLEDPAFWGDFHTMFITCWREMIADALPDHYEARLDEHIYLVEKKFRVKKLTGPDITVLRSRPRKTEPPHSTAGAATLAPVRLPFAVFAEQRRRFIKLIHRPSRKVIAVFELLSPANKRGTTRDSYLAKREATIFQNVHFVELDLLLKGQRLPLGAPVPAADYYYVVSHGDLETGCDVYSWNLDARLPTVPIPLQTPDPDVFCDLGSVFATAYERGRYWKMLDYRKPPVVRLKAEAAGWVKKQVKVAKA